MKGNLYHAIEQERIAIPLLENDMEQIHKKYGKELKRLQKNFGSIVDGLEEILEKYERIFIAIFKTNMDLAFRFGLNHPNLDADVLYTQFKTEYICLIEEMWKANAEREKDEKPSEVDQYFSLVEQAYYPWPYVSKYLAAGSSFEMEKQN